LKSVGTAATALPFYRLLESSAIGAEQPARFIAFYYPHGVAAPLYNKQAADTETAFNLAFAESVLAPFDDAATYGSSFKDKVTIIEGMDLAAGVEKNTNGHDASCVILTGSAPMGEKTANESLDQFLAVTKGLGAQTKFASLVLGVGNKDTASGRNLSYSKAGAPISKIIDPAETYKLLFEGLIVGNDPGAQAMADANRLKGKSVIDNIKAEVARLEKRLAGPEKLKMEQHLSALTELEKRLGGLAGGGGAPAAGCNKPPVPNKADFPKTEVYNGGIPYLDKICDLQIDFIAQAMACDLTRFATLFYFLTEEVHNSVAHQYSTMNKASVSALGKDNKYYFGKCARLLRRLKELGVLDSTLVYMTSDMGDPAAHSLRAVPTVLAGGLNGKIKMGRRLTAKGKSNNQLLVSIANAFGQPITSYGAAGNAAITQGALSELG
jgi:hypothetical protein